MTANNKICLGAIVGVHGIRGEVKVKSFTEDEANLTHYGLLSDKNGSRTFEVKIVGHSHELLRVKIKGIDDRNTAQTFIGTGLYIERSSLPDLPEEEFYHTDLIGLIALNSQGAKLGTVNAIYNFGAGDILELKMVSGKLEMVPFTKEYVPTVNLKDGFIIIEMIEFAPDDREEFSADEDGVSRVED